ncbi:MAG: RluA family pseudouridine synthase [Planctomycetota bacterium]
MATAGTRSFEIAPSLAGVRLDVALTDLLEGWSRSRVQRAIKDGRVRVDGREARRTNASVDAGARIEIDLEDDREVSTDVAGSPIVDLVVLYEDDDLAVIDKPAGLVAHPGPRQRRGTVSDLAVARYGPLPEVQGDDRPGIVHRLDRLTSGVMVIGRTEAALEGLKAQFKDRTVEKTYHAIVHGVPRFDSEWRTGAIGSSPRHADRMRVVPEHLVDELLEAGEARTAETLVERMEDFGAAALVAARPRTGRTHQIRVHLQDAGLPIVGDRVYGPGGALKRPMPAGAPRMERPALHARELSFDHPRTGERRSFTAELPADMAGLLDALRSSAEDQ